MDKEVFYTQLEVDENTFTSGSGDGTFWRFDLRNLIIRFMTEHPTINVKMKGTQINYLWNFEYLI